MVLDGVSNLVRGRVAAAVDDTQTRVSASSFATLNRPNATRHPISP